MALLPGVIRQNLGRLTRLSAQKKLEEKYSRHFHLTTKNKKKKNAA